VPSLVLPVPAGSAGSTLRLVLALVLLLAPLLLLAVLLLLLLVLLLALLLVLLLAAAVPVSHSTNTRSPGLHLRRYPSRR
jgi:hypothetical protein